MARISGLNDGTKGQAINPPGGVSKVPLILLEDGAASGGAGGNIGEGIVFWRDVLAFNDDLPTNNRRPPLGISTDGAVEPGQGGSVYFALLENGEFYQGFFDSGTVTQGRPQRATGSQSRKLIDVVNPVNSVIRDFSQYGGVQIPFQIINPSMQAADRGVLAHNTTRDALVFKHNATINQFRELLRIVAGTPDIPANMQDGGIAVDVTNNVLYFLSGGTWRRAAENGVTGEVPTGLINGANLQYTLSRRPASINSLWAYLDGVLQRPTTDYTLDASPATTFTFAAGQAPPTGADLYAIFI